MGKHMCHCSPHFLCLCVRILKLLLGARYAVKCDFITSKLKEITQSEVSWLKEDTVNKNKISHLLIIQEQIQNGSSAGGELQKSSEGFLIRPESTKKVAHCIFTLENESKCQKIVISSPYHWYSLSVLSVTPHEAPKTVCFHFFMNS